MNDDGLPDIEPIKFPEPAQVNYHDQKQIIEHLRALLDLHDLLAKGYDAELTPFLKKLREVGWGANFISDFMVRASYNTRYEALIDPPIRSRGNQQEFQDNEYRWKH